MSAVPGRLVRQGWRREHACRRVARGVLERSGHGGDHRRRRSRGTPVNSAVLRVEQMAEADRLGDGGRHAGYPADADMRARRSRARSERRFTPRPVSVVCGPGNNGGDGFVAAAALAQSGWPVRVALLGDVETLRNDALLSARRWRGAVEPLTPAVIENAELVIDALFGSGLNRAFGPEGQRCLGVCKRAAHFP